MEEIHHILETIRRTDQRCALATIIHVEGSAYRKEGASMLFLEDGSQIGVLSAGCLESELAAHLPEIWASGGSRRMVFDMQSSDPLSWGETPGCGGVIHVLLEPIDGVLLDHLSTLKEYLNRRLEVTLVKTFEPGGSVADYAFVAGNRHVFGEWRGEVPPALLEWLAEGDWRKSGMRLAPFMSSNVFVHTYEPKPRLLLFGAGQDARPLAAMAAAAGFSVVVSDWRPALCTPDHFPDAEALVLGFPEETVRRIHSTPYDYAMVMTHHFRRDQQLVRLLSERQLCYLGILGSKKRTEHLLNGDPSRNAIRSPAGLAIGAEGPVEIAVSILAELIHIYRRNGMRVGAANDSALT